MEVTRWVGLGLPQQEGGREEEGPKYTPRLKETQQIKTTQNQIGTPVVRHSKESEGDPPPRGLPDVRLGPSAPVQEHRRERRAKTQEVVAWAQCMSLYSIHHEYT